MANERLALTWGAAFFAGSLAQGLARVSGLPAVVLLLAVGLVVGRAGLDLIRPEDLGEGLQPVVGLLVSLVLFEGGLTLRLVGPTVQRSVLQLVGARSVLGLVGASLLAHRLAGLSWPLALVFGAIVLATGPTVVTPLVRQMRLSPTLAQVLEAEGLILEPVAAVLALLLLQLALGSLDGWKDVAGLLVLRLGGGVVIGSLGGLFLAQLLLAAGAPGPIAADLPEGTPEPAAISPLAFGDSGLALQLTLGVLFLLFSGSEALLPESGFPAAVAAGVVVGQRLDARAWQLDALIRQLAQLAITVLFPLLAADVSWAELSPLGYGGLACVLGLMLFRWFVVQAAGVGVPALDWRQKLILGWVAPRGIVTAAVASLFALELEEAGVEGGGALEGLVFLTILLTVGLQGFTAPWLARRLGLSQEAGEIAAEPVPASGG